MEGKRNGCPLKGAQSGESTSGFHRAYRIRLALQQSWSATPGASTEDVSCSLTSAYNKPLTGAYLEFPMKYLTGGRYYTVSNGTFGETFDVSGSVRMNQVYTDMNAGQSNKVVRVYKCPMPDTNPPSGSILINNGDASTEEAAVTLTLGATDTESGVGEMMVSNSSDFSGAQWQRYQTSLPWTLSAGTGTTYVLVQNPNSSPTTVNITYMTPKGPVSQDPFTMDANSRKTINVNSLPGMSKTDCSIHVAGSAPIIAERAMYWGAGTPLGEACHDSIGMDSPHTAFYLPDGETGNGMETWTLVQNPNSKPVSVQVSYLTPDGKGNVAFSDTVPANSRKSYNMADKIPSGRAAVMVTSRTTGGKIMVERAMYWNARGAGTDTIGGFADL